MSGWVGGVVGGGLARGGGWWGAVRGREGQGGWRGARRGGNGVQLRDIKGLKRTLGWGGGARLDMSEIEAREQGSTRDRGAAL